SIDHRVATIGQVLDHARGRVGVVACGGVRAANAHRFLAVASELHSAARTAARSGAGAFDPHEAAAIMTLDRNAMAARSPGLADG
ncbi:MAG: hypothetical protein KDA22_12420, partial [Phycisphaerales bacterium]|nr:hypothetical protein [Phycisphaerales bacterium]